MRNRGRVDILSSEIKKKEWCRCEKLGNWAISGMKYSELTQESDMFIKQ